MIVGRDTRKRLVEAGYDRIAADYLASKRPLAAQTEALLAALIASLSPQSTVLDLGCGAGVPVTRWLAERCAVTGVDLSAQQLALARRLVPQATFIQADMAALDFPPHTFDAVVSTYAIIHLPREEHPTLLAQVARWLKPGGGFLATWPLTAWEGEEANWSDWGATMWWSHHAPDTSLTLLVSPSRLPKSRTKVTRPSFGCWRGRTPNTVIWAMLDDAHPDATLAATLLAVLGRHLG